MSLAFTNMASFDQPHILLEVIHFYYQLMVIHYMHLSSQTFDQIIVVLLGITQHLVK